MLSVAVDVWIGNAAAVLSGCWGAVTRRAQETGYSRTSIIYHHAQRVEHAVATEQAGGVRYEALWAAWAAAEQLPEAKQQEFAATGSSMGLSLGQIVTLLAIFLPQGRAPSRATVGRWVAQASSQAEGLLAVLDQLCQRWVLVWGGKLANEARAAEVPAPVAARPIEMGLDVFHTHARAPARHTWAMAAGRAAVQCGLRGR